MSVYLDWFDAQQRRTPEDLAGAPAERGLFARIEGLVGQEEALLAIPARERTQEQHDRLHSITAELDRVWEKAQGARRARGRERPAVSRRLLTPGKALAVEALSTGRRNGPPGFSTPV